MSWQFIDKWAERVTLEESLKIRNELDNLLDYSVTKSSENKDYYWNRNLLITNPIKEKETYWDIDLFLYCNWKEEINKIQDFIKKHEQVLFSSKNDNILSFLFESKITNKKVQIDLHLIDVNNTIHRNNYFLYYKVPYFFFIYSYLIKSFKEKLNIKISINWLFINHKDQIILVQKMLKEFLKLSLWLSSKDLDYFDSYEKIWKFFSDKWFSKLDLIVTDSWSIKEHLTKNEKFIEIISYLNWDWKWKEKILEDFKKSLPYLDKLLEKHEKIKQENLRIKEERTKEIEFLFWWNLKDISNDKKKFIKNLNNWYLKSFTLIKKMSDLCFSKFNKKIYLVWWPVRDFLLNIKWNDYDLTWQLTPEEFQSLFWWWITKKYWTVFTNFKWLEVEYTPFRLENDFDWRHAWEIRFSQNLEDDAKRRDFTINAIYLDLTNFEFISNWWIEDLNNKIIRCVWDASERFKEDYLRILRWVRLSSKLWFKIDQKTLDEMNKNWREMFDKISKERIIEEYFKWFKVWKNYMNELVSFFKWSWIDDDLMSSYRNSNWDIYEFVKRTFNNVWWISEEELKNVTWSYKWKRFEIRDYVIRNNKEIKDIKSESELFDFLYYHKSLNMRTNKELRYFVKLYFSKISREDWEEKVKMFNDMLSRWIVFFDKEIKSELWIVDTKDFMIRNWIHYNDIKWYILKEYKKKVWLI